MKNLNEYNFTNDTYQGINSIDNKFNIYSNKDFSLKSKYSRLSIGGLDKSVEFKMFLNNDEINNNKDLILHNFTNKSLIFNYDINKEDYSSDNLDNNDIGDNEINNKILKIKKKKYNGNCNCTKSKCRTKYCICKNLGFSCNKNCNCIDCNN